MSNETRKVRVTLEMRRDKAIEMLEEQGFKITDADEIEEVSDVCMEEEGYGQASWSLVGQFDEPIGPLTPECAGGCGSCVTPAGAMCPGCIVGARILNKLAGLRRAQELAKLHLAGVGSSLTEFDQAIDAEAAKERE